MLKFQVNLRRAAASIRAKGGSASIETAKDGSKVLKGMFKGEPVRMEASVGRLTHSEYGTRTVDRFYYQNGNRIAFEVETKDKAKGLEAFYQFVQNSDNAFVRFNMFGFSKSLKDVKTVDLQAGGVDKVCNSLVDCNTETLKGAYTNITRYPGQDGRAVKTQFETYPQSYTKAKYEDMLLRTRQSTLSATLARNGFERVC